MTQANIRLRAIEQSDLDDWCALQNAPNAMAQTLGMPYFSRDQAARMLANPPESLYPIAAEVDGHVVGVATMYVGQGRQRHSGNIGLSVRDDCAGQGVGSALLAALIDLAENWLGLTRLELDVFVDNAVALHLYQQHGFEIEGTKRRWALRDGQYVDAYLMARIRVS
jgi:putative acetyltransferase